MVCLKTLFEPKTPGNISNMIPHMLFLSRHQSDHKCDMERVPNNTLQMELICSIMPQDHLFHGLANCYVVETVAQDAPASLLLFDAQHCLTSQDCLTLKEISNACYPYLTPQVECLARTVDGRFIPSESRHSLFRFLFRSCIVALTSRTSPPVC